MGRANIIQSYFHHITGGSFDPEVRRAAMALLATFPVIKLQECTEFRLKLVKFYKDNTHKVYEALERSYL